MKKLIKIYELRNEYDYYNIVVESYINGQFSQAKKQFFAMPKKYRKVFVLYCQNTFASAEYFNYFFNLL